MRDRVTETARECERLGESVYDMLADQKLDVSTHWLFYTTVYKACSLTDTGCVNSLVVSHNSVYDMLT